MINIKNISLRDEIPQNLLRDPKVSNLADALTRSIEKSASWIDKINYTINLRNLPEVIIDYLLWEMHIGPYEGLILSKTFEEKVNLYEEAIDLHRTKGTPYAIEQVLKIVNLKGDVLEWFEYDGKPFYFLVELDVANEFNNIDDVRRLVLEYKNTRSWFEGFVILLSLGTEYLQNDSYNYDVIFNACGHFQGEKNISQVDSESIKLVNEVYDYKTEYENSEKKLSYIEGDNTVIKDDTYNYAKNFKAANEMDLLTKEVSMQEEKIFCSDETYSFEINYPVCGEFAAEGE